MKLVNPIIAVLSLALAGGCSLSGSNKLSSNTRPTPTPGSGTLSEAETPTPKGTRPNDSPTPSDAISDEVHTPEKGSEERQAIMDALRGNQPVVFQVNFLKVHNGWAWADTTPLDKQGHPTAEGGPNLLHFQNGRWKVMDLSKVPEDPNDPLGSMDASPGYVKNVIKTFPGVPRDIFPK